MVTELIHRMAMEFVGLGTFDEDVLERLHVHFL